MDTRFRELLTEAVAIADKYRADFGGPRSPPPAVTAFKFKTSAKPKAKKGGSPPRRKRLRPHPPRKLPMGPKLDPKVAGLQKQLATAKKKKLMTPRRLTALRANWKTAFTSSRMNCGLPAIGLSQRSSGPDVASIAAHPG